MDQTARSTSAIAQTQVDKIIPSSVGEYNVCAPVGFETNNMFFLIPFPNADLYNVSFRFTGINGHNATFDASRFVV